MKSKFSVVFFLPKNVFKPLVIMSQNFSLDWFVSNSFDTRISPDENMLNRDHVMLRSEQRTKSTKFTTDLIVTFSGDCRSISFEEIDSMQNKISK